MKKNLLTLIIAALVIASPFAYKKYTNYQAAEKVFRLMDDGSNPSIKVITKKFFPDAMSSSNVISGWYCFTQETKSTNGGKPITGIYSVHITIIDDKPVSADHWISADTSGETSNPIDADFSARYAERCHN